MADEAAAPPVVVTITLDTNMLDDDSIERIRRACEAREIVPDIRSVSVNYRERGRPLQTELPRLMEIFRLDETPLGSGVLASEADVERSDEILRIISNGSFPPRGQRGSLTAPQLRQMRDAMSYEAHLRASRDVFITADLRGFVNHGRRERLEALGPTRIIAAREVGAIWP